MSENNKKDLPSRSERNKENSQNNNEKNNQLRYVLIIGALLIVLIIVLFSIFSNSNNNTDSDTASLSSVVISSSDSSESETESESESTSSSEETSEETTSESESESEESTESQEPPLDDVEIVGSELEEAEYAYTGDWEPVGTEQTGEHVTDYSEGSADRQEIRQAVAGVTGLDPNSMIEWWVGNDGTADGVYATVSDSSNSQQYRVHLKWIDGQGWQAQRVDVLAN